MKRWVANQETSLVDLLRSSGVDDATCHEAIAAGRLFVGQRRIERLPVSVPRGAEVVLHDRPVDMVLPEPFVLHLDRGIVAVHKPAGIPTIADLRSREGCLADLVARTLGLDPATVHATSRLDREVSGVVVFATDRDGREWAQRARDEGRYTRRYLALVETRAKVASGPFSQVEDEVFRWSWPIGRAKDPRFRRIAPNEPDALASESRGRLVTRASDGGFGLLALMPRTGRTHQLRVHCAAAAMPIVGDVWYGASRRLVLPSGRVVPCPRVALHCAWVRIDLAGRPSLEVRAPIPGELVTLAETLGLGDPDAAARCELS